MSRQEADRPILRLEIDPKNGAVQLFTWVVRCEGNIGTPGDEMWQPIMNAVCECQEWMMRNRPHKRKQPDPESKEPVACL
jgi:hypothetical protein